MRVASFMDEQSNTFTYVVSDPDTGDAVLIDPVLDLDPAALRVGDAGLRRILAYIDEADLTLRMAIDTHVHADHMSGLATVREMRGVPIAIGSNVHTVQETFKKLLGLPAPFPADGSQWDHRLDDGETLQAGSIAIEAIHTPGHTPACVTYKIGDALFTGDTLFMPDFGTGRCDFPGGSAEALFDSVQRLYQLPDETRVFVGHDYGPGGREPLSETTVGDSKTQNKQLRVDTPREEFVSWRSERDAGLKPPRLIFQALMVNIDAGRLPSPDANGIRYLRLPLNVL